jgi:glucose uptake protein GlcU
LLFLFVKANVTDESTAAEIEPLISNRRLGYETIDSLANEDEDNGRNFLQNFSQLKKRILGVGLSVTAGICVGLTYAPYLYVIDRYDNASKNGLDYVFSMFTGGLISTFIYYFFYCIIKKNKPYVNPTSILPGCANGWIWGKLIRKKRFLAILNLFCFKGVGVSCFQFSNSVLSQAITFPIALGLQSLMGVLYGVFLFKEIRGERNLVILILGFIATVSGTTLCGISKY